MRQGSKVCKGVACLVQHGCKLPIRDARAYSDGLRGRVNLDAFTSRMEICAAVESAMLLKQWRLPSPLQLRVGLDDLGHLRGIRRRVDAVGTVVQVL